MIILADGFEELEAIAVIDILRRARIKVVVTGLDHSEVTSTRGITILADSTLQDEDDHEFDVIILPGGEPGATHLQQSDRLTTLLTRQYQSNKWIAAICSAPRILAGLGILENRRATSFPNAAPYMTGCVYETKPVVVDGPIITARGPAVAIRFGLTIVEKLVGRSVANDIKKAMLYDAR